MRRSNSARLSASSLARRSCQACRDGLPRAPALRHCSRMSEGISNGGEVQPRFCAGRGDLFGAERRAVGFCGAAFVRRAEADRGAAGDHRRPVGFFRRFDRSGNRRRIVTVDAGRRPARGLKALHLIDGIGQRDRPVDGDVIVVVEHDQLFQLQVAGKRDRFLADAFHQVAIGDEHVGGVIDDVAAVKRRKVAFRDRHADGIGKALAERSGGGFDARRVAVFGMAGRLRAELPEALDLVDRHLLVAEQIEQRIKQHRAVTGRQHEAVAVGPRWIGRIEFQETREQHGRDVGRAHRQARMSGICFLDRIHRQRPDGIRHAVMVRARRGTRAAARETSVSGEGWALGFRRERRPPWRNGPAWS